MVSNLGDAISKARVHQVYPLARVVFSAFVDPHLDAAIVGDMFAGVLGQCGSASWCILVVQQVRIDDVGDDARLSLSEDDKSRIDATPTSAVSTGSAD